MKRVGNLYERIAEPDNLRLAFLKAARGKQDRPEVIDFRAHLADNIKKIYAELVAEQPDIGHYRFFEVRDPKRRTICAASFRERVLHHAIMHICEPVLERYAIFDSYACRPGKGSRKAVARAKLFVERSSWYLKLDIRKYFDSIDHDVLLAQLGRRFKDKRLLALFAKLLATYHTVPGKGLPIGNLVSQHLANFHLGELDHWLKEVRGCKDYLRYMDDFVLFGNDKKLLREELVAIAQFLATRLGLRLKDNIQLNRCRQGLPFLGYRLFPARIRLLPASRARFVQRFREYEQLAAQGVWSEQGLARHMEPLIDFTRVADATSFRRGVIAAHGVSS